jgi:DNA-binding NtrC family response regulator
VESAIEAMKLGALDYLQKPFEIDELLVVVRRALDHQRLRTEYRYLVSERDEQFDHYGIVGRSRAMEEVIKRAELVAETKSTVLITGETGTGKELVARAIHDESVRQSGPFVKVNCAAVPRELLESELFGHERGAFTGAHQLKIGKFEAADRGTIFLDEIGDLHPALQGKLLHVLQDGQFSRVGGRSTIKVDVRVLAATNQDLEQAVAAARFREDLYYRLKVVEIRLPALRERPEDLPALAERFLAQVAERLGRPKKRLTPDALAALASHAWPGNARELRNLIEQSVVLATSEEIGAGDLLIGGTPASGRVAAAERPFSEAKRAAVEGFEREFLLRALRANEGNVSRTAEAIGMVRQSLQQKIRELGLRDEDWSRSD